MERKKKCCKKAYEEGHDEGLMEYTGALMWLYGEAEKEKKRRKHGKKKTANKKA